MLSAQGSRIHDARTDLRSDLSILAQGLPAVLRAGLSAMFFIRRLCGGLAGLSAVIMAGCFGLTIHLINPVLLGEKCKPIIIRDGDKALRFARRGVFFLLARRLFGGTCPLMGDPIHSHSFLLDVLYFVAGSLTAIRSAGILTT